jgi:hypothetical protein
MFIDWWYEEYNPGDVTRPGAPTRQVQRKRRKSRFEVLVQFLVPAGLMGLVFWNLYIGLPLHTWLILLGTVLLYFVVSFAVYPVEHPDRHNLPNTLLKHPFRLARTKHGIQRILALLLMPGWLMSKTIVRLFTLLRYATVRGKQADQLYYSTNLSVDKWWVLPGLVMIALSYSPLGELSIPGSENDVGFLLAYIGGFPLIFGIRARNAFMEVCHKIIATIWAVPPTFVLVAMIIWILFVIPTTVLIPGSPSVSLLLNVLVKQIPIILIVASITFASWSLTRHLVYEKYSREAGESDAHVITLALLFFFGGALGLHRFYTDRILTGMLYMCTMGLFGIGLIYDGVLLVFGRFDTS